MLEARGAPELLGAPDAWRLIDETERAVERGLDPVAILVATTNDQVADVDNATGVLRRARLYPEGERAPYPVLVAGLVPAAAAGTPPDIAAYLDGLAAGLTRRRQTLADQCREGPVPSWAASLGQPPSKPPVRARWADEVADVGLWRETHGIAGGEALLGPNLPPGHRDGASQRRAAMAAAEAIELSTGKVRHDPYRGWDDPAPHQGPTVSHGPSLGR